MLSLLNDLARLVETVGGLQNRRTIGALSRGMRDLFGSLARRLLVLPLLFVASCTAYLPFTDRTAERYRLGADERSLLQYFVSDEFYLRRDTTDENAQITAGGTVRYFRGRRIEELRIRRHTPGAAVAIGEGGLGISFVPGDDRNAIFFAPDSDYGGEETFDADRPSRFAAPPPGLRTGRSSERQAERRTERPAERYIVRGDAQRQIQYDDKLWTVHYERRPYLLIRGRDVEDQETRVKTLPGRTVGK